MWMNERGWWMCVSGRYVASIYVSVSHGYAPYCDQGSHQAKTPYVRCLEIVSPRVTHVLILKFIVMGMITCTFVHCFEGMCLQLSLDHRFRRCFLLSFRHPEQSLDAPVSLHIATLVGSGGWSSLLGNLLQLSMVANKS